MQSRWLTSTTLQGVITLAVMILTGCSTTAEMSRTGVNAAGGVSSRRLGGTSAAAVQPVAERVFRQHFKIDAAASGAGLLVAQPQEVTAEMPAEGVREVLSGARRRHRYLAELRINQQGEDVLLRCIVQTQRLETSERAAFSTQRGEDRPTETPIDRMGPSSADNREEWVPSKRDRTLEQEILTAIQQAIQPATSEAK
jgi:hypothetical protein